MKRRALPVRAAPRVPSLLAGVAVVIVVACGCAPARPTGSPASVAVMAPAPPRSPPAPGECPVARTAAVSGEERALDAYAAGRYLDSLELAHEILGSHPTHPVASALRRAVMSRLLAMDAAIARAEPTVAPIANGLDVVLAPLEGRARVLAPVARPPNAPPLRVVLEGERTVARSLRDHEAAFSSTRALVPEERVRRRLAQSARGPAVVPYDDHLAVLLHGDQFLLADSVGAVSRYERGRGMSPARSSVRQAARFGDAVIVQLDSAIAAFDLQSGALRWESPPGTAGASPFLLVGGSLIVIGERKGEERGEQALTVVDATSGAVAQRIRLAKRWHRLARRGDRLSAVGESERDDERLELRARLTTLEGDPFDPVPTARSGLEVQRRRCLRAAGAALHARDRGAMVAALEGLRARGLADASLDEALFAALSIEPLHAPLVLSAPAAIERAPSPERAGAHPRFVVRRLHVGPTDRLPDPRDSWHVDYDYVDKPLPSWMPPQFGAVDLRRVLPSRGDRSFLFYGSLHRSGLRYMYAHRYMLVARGRRLEQAFDLVDFLAPGTKGEVDLEVVDARVVAGKLYVCTGSDGVVTAFDLATGAGVWRSAPSICNHTIDDVVTSQGALLVASYIATNGSGLLRLVRADTGAVLDTFRSPRGLEEVSVDGLRVEGSWRRDDDYNRNRWTAGEVVLEVKE